MKIATFNINNINRRLPNLLAWMRAAKPDVLEPSLIKFCADFYRENMAKLKGTVLSTPALKRLGEPALESH